VGGGRSPLADRRRRRRGGCSDQRGYERGGRVAVDAVAARAADERVALLLGHGIEISPPAVVDRGGIVAVAEVELLDEALIDAEVHVVHCLRYGAVDENAKALCASSVTSRAAHAAFGSVQAMASRAG
jgi:hypothetical protein